MDASPSFDVTREVADVDQDVRPGDEERLDLIMKAVQYAAVRDPDGVARTLLDIGAISVGEELQTTARGTTTQRGSGSLGPWAALLHPGARAATALPVGTARHPHESRLLCAPAPPPSDHNAPAAGPPP
ncbi:hypothetical protein ACIQWR_38860 [Streptomyces sp. NPDC098789]|uniref:hypothetical protein n=1 Tax=Streptomyces sp. NPDC098789 TaxID=3366098 RepID=UPI00382483A1